MCMGSPSRAPAQRSSVQQWPKKEQDRNKQTACSGCSSAPDVRTTGAGQRWQPPRACAYGQARQARSHSSAIRRALRLHSMQSLTCYVFHQQNSSVWYKCSQSAVSAHNQVCMQPANWSGTAQAGKTARKWAARGPDGCQNLQVQLANRLLCCQAKVALDACAYVHGKAQDRSVPDLRTRTACGRRCCWARWRCCRARGPPRDLHCAAALPCADQSTLYVTETGLMTDLVFWSVSWIAAHEALLQTYAKTLIKCNCHTAY